MPKTRRKCKVTTQQQSQKNIYPLVVSAGMFLSCTTKTVFIVINNGTKTKSRCQFSATMIQQTTTVVLVVDKNVQGAVGHLGGTSTGRLTHNNN